MKTLKLTLEKKWFDLMVSCRKFTEFREDKPWIRSRLFDKDGSPRKYDYVEFTNGYGKDKPWFRAPFEGFFQSDEDLTYHFIGGSIFVPKGTFCIEIGYPTETRYCEGLLNG